MATAKDGPAQGVVQIDGVVVTPERAVVSAFDRGFLFGDSVFEVMRTYGGHGPFRGMRHLERLRRSCERILLSLPVSLELLRVDVDAAIAAAGLPDCYVRVLVSRGDGPLNMDLETALSPRRLVYALPLRLLPADHYRQGVGVRLVHAGRGADASRDAGAKSSNYLTSLLASHEVRTQGAHEAVLVGPLGEILEGATSNVFLVKHGVLRTPPLRSGILQGITRDSVHVLAQSGGIPAEETPLYPCDLYAADEVFITSSVREILPVVTVDGATVGTGEPGPVTRRLMDAYRAWAVGGGWED